MIIRGVNIEIRMFCLNLTNHECKETEKIMNIKFCFSQKMFHYEKMYVLFIYYLWESNIYYLFIYYLWESNRAS